MHVCHELMRSSKLTDAADSCAADLAVHSMMCHHCNGRSCSCTKTLSVHQTLKSMYAHIRCQTLALDCDKKPGQPTKTKYDIHTARLTPTNFGAGCQTHPRGWVSMVACHAKCLTYMSQVCPELAVTLLDSSPIPQFEQPADLTTTSTMCGDFCVYMQFSGATHTKHVKHSLNQLMLGKSHCKYR